MPLKWRKTRFLWLWCPEKCPEVSKFFCPENKNFVCPGLVVGSVTKCRVLSSGPNFSVVRRSHIGKWWRWGRRIFASGSWWSFEEKKALTMEALPGDISAHRRCCMCAVCFFFTLLISKIITNSAVHSVDSLFWDFCWALTVVVIPLIQICILWSEV